MEENDNLETVPQQPNQNETGVLASKNDSKQAASSEVQSSTTTTSNDPKGNTSNDGAGEVVKPIGSKEKNPKKM